MVKNMRSYSGKGGETYGYIVASLLQLCVKESKLQTEIIITPTLYTNTKTFLATVLET